MATRRNHSLLVVACTFAVSLKCFAAYDSFYGIGTTSYNGLTWRYRVSYNTSDASSPARVGAGQSTDRADWRAIPKSTTGAIVVPSVLDGRSIVGLYDYAFQDCAGITSVAIPSTVTSLGCKSFVGCSGLVSVDIPNSVKSVICYTLSGSGFKDTAFPDCANIKRVTISPRFEFSAIFPASYRNIETVTMPGGESVISNKAFAGCSNLSTVNIASDIKRIGARAFEGCVNLYDIPLPDGLTAIESSAFSGCRGLTSIQIPDNTSSVSGDAFAGCTGLRKVSIPQCVIDLKMSSVFADSYQHITNVVIGNTATSIKESAFEGCESLEQISIPDSVTKIGDFAFSGCEEMSEISIGKGVSSVGREVFRNCRNLVTINVAEDNQDFIAMDGCLFSKDGATLVTMVPWGNTSVTIPDGVKRIGDHAFSSCTNLVSVYMPDSVTEISPHAFSGCSRLVSVTMSNSLTNIGDYAFYNCSSLTNVTIPNSVREIGVYAFYNCNGFSHVAIPNGVTSIGNKAFLGCSNLKEVTIPQYVCASRLSTIFPSSYQAITNIVFDGDVTNIGSYAFKDCCELANVALPNGVTDIGDYAFSACVNLANVSVPDSMMTIGACSFSGCTSLDNVILPSSITNIGTSAFSGCSSLTRVSVPPCVSSLSLTFPAAYQRLNTVIVDDGVTNIASRMFAGCSGLVQVAMPSSITTIGEDAFEGCLEFSRLEIADIGAWTQISFDGAIDTSYDLYLNGVRMREIVIPDNVYAVSAWAFAGCTSVEEVVLSEGLDMIGKGAFQGCDNIFRVTLASTLTNLGDFDLRDIEVPGSQNVEGFRVVNGWVLGYENDSVSRLEIPEGCIGIAPYALSDFWDLEEVEFPESLKYIGYGAFKNDTCLDNVTIPNGVEYIDGEAFKNCTYLRDVVIGSDVKKIGNEAFANCTQLAALTIPDGVAEIGDCAFSNCWRMLSIKMPFNLETIGENLFTSCSSLAGVSVSSGKFTMGQLLGARSGSITSAVILDGETTICSNAFSNCSLLETVSIPEGVTNIQAEAFRNCSKLRDVALPETLEKIEHQAFYGCSYLGAIVLPDSVTVIGNGAFRSCSTLNSVTLSRNLIEVPDYAFYGCNTLVSIVVPSSVTRLGAYLSNKLTSLYFLGNAPAYDANAYASLPSNAKTYVVQGSRGWDGIPSSRDLPSSWIGRGITTWTPNRFYATFDANEGQFPDHSATYACEQITDTSYAIPPFEPTRTAYAFAGWWTDRTAGAQVKATTRVNETRDITFYAHWTLVNKPVSVRFYANGGTVEPEEATYYAGLPYQRLPVPTKEYYRFTGWYTMAEGGTQVQVSSEVPAAGAELFAHWSPETYVIRYNANGGNGNMADQSFVYGSSVTLRANSFWRQNCSFTGWGVTAEGPVVYADKKDLSTIGAIQGGVINLYAQWTATQYAVRYDSNGGVGIMTNDTFTTGVSATLSPNAFTRAGYVFIGWAATADGEVSYGDVENVVDLTTTANGCVSLFAVWAKNASNVVLSFDGGDNAWRPSSFAKDGEVVWQSGDIGNSENSTLVATVNGSGTISFDWSSSCEDSFRGMRLDYVAFFIDGDEKEFLNGNSTWAAKSYVVEGAGPHILKWQYIKDSAGSDYEDCARISAVSWEPSLSTLEEFANANNLTFATTGDAVWFGQAAVSHDGAASLQSGAISDGEKSRLESEVVGAGELSFWWKVSSEEPFRGIPLDYMSFELDGVRQSWIAGETDWTNVTISVEGNGRHTFAWIYQKDEWEGTSGGEDCAWLDEVIWTPASSMPVISDDANADVVNAVVESVGFADVAIKTAIGGSASEYKAFKTWASGVAGGEAAVVASTNAAVSYLLGAERLFVNPPEIEFGECNVASDTGEVTVSITVKDGEDSVAVASEKVKEMFEATSDLSDWNGAGKKLTPIVTDLTQGRANSLNFKVRPGDGTSQSAFLRIRK